MKIRKLPLLLVPFLLVSCGGIESLTIDEGREIIANFSASQTYTTYDVDAHIYIAALPVEDNSVEDETFTFNDMPDSQSTMVDNIANDLLSSSYYLGAPLKLTVDNFYSLTTKTNPPSTEGESESNGRIHYAPQLEIDKSNCVYGIIHSLLIYASGSTSELYLKSTSTGGLIFCAYNSNTFLTINNVNNEVYGSEVYQNTGNYAGRINGEFEYNNEGLLIRETIWSMNYVAEKVATDASMLFLESTYTYNA